MGSVRRPDLTPTELLVLYEAGGDNDLGNAYGAVQIYSAFERESDLIDAVEAALLRLFDLRLIRLVQADWDDGYTIDHSELPAMTREQLVQELARERDPTDTRRELNVFYDPTPEGEALIRSTPKENIPDLSGLPQRRPWTER